MMRLLTGFLLGCCVGSVLAATPAPVKNLSDSHRIDILERRISKLTELVLRLDGLEQENRQLHGEVETLNHRVQQIQRKQRDIYADIDQRLADLASQPAAQAQMPQAVKPPRVVQQPATPAAAADPAKIRAEYDAAYKLLSPAQRQYAQAITAFKTFLTKYPQDKLAANAQYWLAETYYVMQNNPTALTAFKKVVSQYPDSPKVAGAWYKIGRIEQASGRSAAAIAAYQTIVKRYPQSPAVGLAQQALVSLQTRKK